MTTKKKMMTMTTMNSLRPFLRPTIWGAALAFGLCLAPAPASTQQVKPGEPYALIFGTVFGPDSRPAAHVKIKIRRGDHKRAKWELVSDRRGEFAQRFPAGEADYYIRTEIPKKYGIENKELKVHIANDERQDIALHLTKAQTTEKQK
ncbi:MAG: hypothetical protein ABIP12_03255 [Terriglobales bacterium]